MTSTTALKIAIVPKAARQPRRSPITAPIGTPRTEAAETPPKMIAVARPIDSAGTNLGARPPAIAQMPPMQNPTMMRAANSQPMVGASADRRLAMVSKASSPARMRRLSMPPEARTATGANRAARRAGTEIVNPAVPTDVSSVSAIGVISPTGSISVVTTENVDRPTAQTGTQGCRLSGFDSTRSFCSVRSI